MSDEHEQCGAGQGVLRGLIEVKDVAIACSSGTSVTVSFCLCLCLDLAHCLSSLLLILTGILSTCSSQVPKEQYASLSYSSNRRPATGSLHFRNVWMEYNPRLPPSLRVDPAFGQLFIRFVPTAFSLLLCLSLLYFKSALVCCSLMYWYTASEWVSFRSLSLYH